MIHLSDTAVAEVKRLRNKHLKSNTGLLRLGIQPGSCAHLSYRMEFVQQQQPQDFCFQTHSIQVAVDPESFPFLDGLTLDYSEDLMGGGFRFHNPNATQTCGCGNSFNVDKSGDLEKPI